MPERKYTAASAYRYGFNGKENDNEVKGEGNQQDYGMRIYDPRVGKFLSVDPIATLYPMLTPYQFASNRPMDGIDLDGKEFFKKDEYNYRMDYYPVVNAGSVGQGVGNAIGNVGSFLWNGTFGALLEGSKSINNYFAGGYKEPSTNIVATFDQWQTNAYKYHTTTPAKQQLKDFGNAATDLRNYEALPSLLIAHNIPISKIPLANRELAILEETISTTKSLPSPYSRFTRFETKYAEHSKTFGTSGNMSRTAYYNRAIKLADSDIGGDVLGFTSEGNTTFKLNKKTGEFAVINPDGKISSFYRRVKDPVKYLEEQKKKYGVKKNE